jgi:hypothetical protein
MTTLADWANQQDPDMLDHQAQDYGITRWLDRWQGETVLLHDPGDDDWAVMIEDGTWAPWRPGSVEAVTRHGATA